MQTHTHIVTEKTTRALFAKSHPSIKFRTAACLLAVCGLIGLTSEAQAAGRMNASLEVKVTGDLFSVPDATGHTSYDLCRSVAFANGLTGMAFRKLPLDSYRHLCYYLP